MKTNHTPVQTSEPEGTRTPNLLIRSQVHYPIMLRVQKKRCKDKNIFCYRQYPVQVKRISPFYHQF